MRIVLLLIPLATAIAHADSIGPPLGPIDRTIVAEQPCTGDAPSKDTTLAGRYMCQIGLDGAWFQPYACEIIKSTSTSSYLRHAKWNIPCDLVATIGNKKLGVDGSTSCAPADGSDVIGIDAIVTGRLATIPGGFRFETKIVLRTTTPIGPDDAVVRETRTTTTKPKLAVNICRRPWPAGFTSDIERAEALQRSRP